MGKQQVFSFDIQIGLSFPLSQSVNYHYIMTSVTEQQSLLGRRNQPPISCKPQEWQFSEAIAAVSWKRFWTPKSQMGCTTYNSSINFTNQLIILNSLVKFQLIPDCDFSINPKYTLIIWKLNSVIKPKLVFCLIYSMKKREEIFVA